MCLHFRDKNVVWDSTKCFAEVQADGISHSSLIHQYCNAVVEGHHISQELFALSEAMLIVTDHLLIFCVP